VTVPALLSCIEKYCWACLALGLFLSILALFVVGGRIVGESGCACIWMHGWISSPQKIRLFVWGSTELADGCGVCDGGFTSIYVMWEGGRWRVDIRLDDRAELDKIGPGLGSGGGMCAYTFMVCVSVCVCQLPSAHNEAGICHNNKLSTPGSIQLMSTELLDHGRLVVIVVVGFIRPLPLPFSTHLIIIHIIHTTWDGMS
jgi:hypothetical protein